MGLEFQYQLCPTLLLADMEIENPSLAFLYALSDEIRAQTSLFGIVPKIYICIISLITMYLLKFYNGHGGFCYAARSFWSWKLSTALASKFVDCSVNANWNRVWFKV